MSFTASIAPEQSETVCILHVDDEPDLADLTAAFLTREDDRFVVETATSAADGLELLARHEFDCIISDYDMPGQTGIEFLEAVREDDADIPFILYTGKGSEEVASDAISAGVTDYLQKQSGSDQYKLLANRVANAVEQYRARQAMEHTRRRFRTLVEEATDAILVVESDGTLVYATPSAETILGRPPEELVGTSGFDPIHPDDQEHVMAEFASLVDNPDDRRTVEFRYQQPDESYIWAEARGRNLLDEPLIDGVVVYTRDITDRKERELELQRQERRYQAVFNDPNILVGLIDTDGTVLDINQTAMEYIDVTLDDVAGEPFWETPWFNHSEAVQDEVKQWINRAADNEYVEFETELVRPNGDPYTVAGVFRPVTNDDGEVVSLIISDRDITEQKAYEQKLERTNTLLSTLFDTLTVGVLAEDVSREVLAVNDRMFDLFDLSGTPDEVVGADCKRIAEDVSELFVDPDAFVKRITEVIDAGDPVRDEEVMVTDGRTFARDHEPIDLPTGDGHLWVYRDVTERNAREEELRRYEHIVETMHDGAWIADQNGTLTFVNQVIADLLDTSQDDLIGLGMVEALEKYDLADPDTIAAYEQLVAEVLAGEHDIVHTDMDITLQNQTVELDIELVPYRIGTDIEGVVGVSRMTTPEDRD